MRLFRSDGLDLVEASDGIEALRAMFQRRPDAAIVGVNSPGIDGYELVRILRAACDVPIIALVPQSDAMTVVRALESGADDVIEEGCQANELVARMSAVIRRYQRRTVSGSTPRQVATGGLVIDMDTETVTRDGEPVHLTRTEYRLLEAMAAHPGETSPHRSLLSTVWGEACVDDTHYLRVYVGYLRQKLENDPSDPRYIVNEWGLGYRLARLPIQERATAAVEETDASRVAVGAGS